MKLFTKLSLATFAFALLLGASSASAQTWSETMPTCGSGEKMIERSQSENASCPFFTQWMKKGDRDGQLSKEIQIDGTRKNISEVSKLQGWLNRNLGANLITDGIFGNKTDSAVRGYQTTYQKYILNPWGLTSPTGRFKNTSEWFANYLTGCIDPEVDLDGKGSYKPFDAASDEVAQLTSSLSGSNTITEYACVGEGEEVDEDDEPKKTSSRRRGGSGSSRPAVVATADITSATDDGADTTIDSSGSTATGTVTVYEGWFMDSDGDNDPTTGTPTWATESAAGVLPVHGGATGTIPGVTLATIPDGASICHVVSSSATGTDTGSYVDITCMTNTLLPIFADTDSSGDRDATGSEDLACTHPGGYTYPITLADTTVVADYAGLLAYAGTTYPAPYVVSDTSATDACNVSVLYDADTQAVPEAVEAAPAIAMTNLGITSGFTDTAGNPTDSPYVGASGVNDGTDVIYPNVQRGYDFEICETGGVAYTGLVIDLTGDITSLVNPWVENLPSTTGGATITTPAAAPSAALAGTSITVDLPANSCLDYSVRGEVTSNGGNIGDVKNEYMNGTLDEDALTMTATLNGTTIADTSTGALSVNQPALGGESSPFHQNPEVFSVSNTDSDFTNNYGDSVGQQVWYYSDSILVDGVELLVGTTPAGSPAPGFETNQQSVDWWVANNPQFAAYWGHNWNVNSHGRRSAWYYGGTYYTLTVVSVSSTQDRGRDGVTDGTNSFDGMTVQAISRYGNREELATTNLNALYLPAQ